MTARVGINEILESDDPSTPFPKTIIHQRQCQHLLPE